MADAVRAGAGREEVEVAVLEAGGLADGVGVGGAVALAVVRPLFGGAVGVDAAASLPSTVHTMCVVSPSGSVTEVTRPKASRR